MAALQLTVQDCVHGLIVDALWQGRLNPNAAATPSPQGGKYLECSVEAGGPDAYGKATRVAANASYLSSFFRLKSGVLSAGNSFETLKLVDADGDGVAYVKCQNDSGTFKLNAYFYDDNVFAGGNDIDNFHGTAPQTILEDTWYHIRYLYDIPNLSAKFEINGILSGAEKTLYAATRVPKETWAGIVNSDEDVNRLIVLIDDVQWDTSGWVLKYAWARSTIHGHLVDAVVAERVRALTPRDTIHGHLADVTALSRFRTATVQSTLHGHLVDTVQPSGIYGAIVQSTLHGGLASIAAATRTRSLTIQSPVHAQLVDAGAITRIALAAVRDTVHGHLVSAVDAVRVRPLTVLDTIHGHLIDTPLGVRVRLPVAQSTIHGHLASTPTLPIHATLLVRNSIHGHLASAFPINTAKILTVQSSVHGHLADIARLSVTYELAVQSPVHGSLADTISAVRIRTMTLQDAVHGHLADIPSLPKHAILSLLDTVHGHVADAVAPVRVRNPIIQEPVHGQVVDSALATAVRGLGAHSAIHGHLASICELRKGVSIPHHVTAAQTKELVFLARGQAFTRLASSTEHHFVADTKAHSHVAGRVGYTYVAKKEV